MTETRRSTGDPQPRANPSPRPRPAQMLGIWAHPDDEAYLSAGFMAQVVDAGGRATVVAITDGEAGFPGDDVRPSRERRRRRRCELRSAMAAIGVTDVRFLGVPDGSVATAPASTLVRAIAGVIDELRPDLVVTFGPDGITGHEDHVANSDLVTRAWLGCGHGELYYAAKTTGWLDEWRGLHDEFGVWMTEEPTGVTGDEVELAIGLSGAELDRKRAVLAAHHSQTAGLAAAFGEDRYRQWIREETFRRPTGAELDAAGGRRADRVLVTARGVA